MIVHDMIGLFERFVPKFVKRYANLSPILLEAFSQYHDDVKAHVPTARAPLLDEGRGSREAARGVPVCRTSLSGSASARACR